VLWGVYIGRLGGKLPCPNFALFFAPRAQKMLDRDIRCNFSEKSQKFDSVFIGGI
jgi:hypothetical protein